jgi:hypothetical protein
VVSLLQRRRRALLRGAFIVAGAGVVMAASTAFGGPPLDPFPYPPVTIGCSGACGQPAPECGQHNGYRSLNPAPGDPSFLPTAYVGWGVQARQATSRGDGSAGRRRPNRVVIARTLQETRQWAPVLQPADRYAVAHIRFARCALIAVFHRGNDVLSLIGLRLNDPTSLSAGLIIAPQPSETCTGTTGAAPGLPLAPPPGCEAAPPLAASYVVAAVPARSVAQVTRLYVVFQPPETGGTTG